MGIVPRSVPAFGQPSSATGYRQLAGANRIGPILLAPGANGMVLNAPAAGPRPETKPTGHPQRPTGNRQLATGNRQPATEHDGGS